MKKNGALAVGLLAGFLITFSGGSGLSFVTPEHYEKIKQAARIKEKQADQAEREVPGKIQVHPPSESKPASGGTNKK
jgi:hypothetical protein